MAPCAQSSQESRGLLFGCFGSDRVRAERLLEKLRCKGVHPTMVALTESWLQQRTAHVVVVGHFSNKMVLKNMVFQGTVLGPSFWNLFYEDARRAIHETSF